MNVQQSVYSKGDWIVHANYGVGQVREMEKKELDGEKKVFYRVKTFDGEYWLSVFKTDVEYIRPVTSEHLINRALTMMRKPPEKLHEDHNKRTKIVNEAIKDSSVFTKACMIRDLNGKEQESRLNFTEEDALLKIKKQFLDEWSVIKNVDREILEEKLEKALETSVEKIPKSS
jgi:RNA polymerase-interacting CarD/CdnL/TRCF family regulator